MRNEHIPDDEPVCINCNDKGCAHCEAEPDPRLKSKALGREMRLFALNAIMEA